MRSLDELYRADDPVLASHPYFDAVFRDVLSIPEAQEMLQGAMALHGRALTFKAEREPGARPGPSYEPNSHTIFLDLETLDNEQLGYPITDNAMHPFTLNRTILHELRHATQPEAIEVISLSTDLKRRLSEPGDLDANEATEVLTALWELENRTVAQTDALMLAYYDEPARGTYRGGYYQGGEACFASLRDEAADQIVCVDMREGETLGSPPPVAGTASAQSVRSR